MSVISGEIASETGHLDGLPLKIGQIMIGSAMCPLIVAPSHEILQSISATPQG